MKRILDHILVLIFSLSVALIITACGEQTGTGITVNSDEKSSGQGTVSAQGDPAEVDPMTARALESDPMTARALESDPKTAKALETDPVTARALGDDPMTPGIDPMTARALESDPKMKP